MSKWIDAEKLIEKHGDWYTEEGSEVGFIGSIKQLIETQPSIDLVRCKDCKHYESDGGCLMVCGVTKMVVGDEDYCSFGERIEP